MICSVALPVRRVHRTAWSCPISSGIWGSGKSQGLSILTTLKLPALKSRAYMGSHMTLTLSMTLSSAYLIDWADWALLCWVAARFSVNDRLTTVQGRSRTAPNCQAGANNTKRCWGTAVVESLARWAWNMLVWVVEYGLICWMCRMCWMWQSWLRIHRIHDIHDLRGRLTLDAGGWSLNPWPSLDFMKSLELWFGMQPTALVQNTDQQSSAEWSNRMYNIQPRLFAACGYMCISLHIIAMQSVRSAGWAVPNNLKLTPSWWNSVKPRKFHSWNYNSSWSSCVAPKKLAESWKAEFGKEYKVVLWKATSIVVEDSIPTLAFRRLCKSMQCRVVSIWERDTGNCH